MYAALYHPFLTDIGHQEYRDNLCGRLSEALQAVHVVIVGQDVQLDQWRRRLLSNSAVSAVCDCWVRPHRSGNSPCQPGACGASLSINSTFTS